MPWLGTGMVSGWDSGPVASSKLYSYPIHSSQNQRVSKLKPGTGQSLNRKGPQTNRHPESWAHGPTNLGTPQVLPEQEGHLGTSCRLSALPRPLPPLPHPEKRPPERFLVRTSNEANGTDRGAFWRVRQPLELFPLLPSSVYSRTES